MSLISVLLLILCLLIVCIETHHSLRPKSPLLLKPFSWRITTETDHINLNGRIKIINPDPKMEVMVPELKAKVTLLGNKDLDGIKSKISIIPWHPDEKSREDGYWFAYIVKSKKETEIELDIELNVQHSNNKGNSPDNIWVEINWINYGPFGRIKCHNCFIVSIKRPKPLTSSEANFIEGKGYSLLPVKTHLLGMLDNCSEVLDQYTKNIRKPDDIITIGETPLAVMQGRYLHPSTINPSGIAKILCKAFHPTSSLATACGLQTLIDLVGPTRVIIAWSLGAGMKLIGIKGGFYRLAGEQARLIDDITGTTPPYDQTIVLGPKRSKEICDEASKRLGARVAIVDVNDLGRVKVVASSSNCDKSLLLSSLQNNPAGNANQQTPIVLVRPNQNKT
ncbi:F420-0:Gamma-glutamyl ligase [Prochlorococcus sp. MIT 1341]|uniref:F420-0:Gamma-glutamyl ligase n=1 Tax=Prochlorococcus sp. MIT 1341 TaxID=3096221 RepID=UPI002A748F05|nr:F420-0:Gamma-glutamyl ligase [Prochlorococcus sp. MIT 1341]